MGLLATNDDFPDWTGPYLDEMPVDPWGNDYFFDPDYRIDGVKQMVIGSSGPNGSGLNVYDEDNIIIILSNLPCDLGLQCANDKGSNLYSFLMMNQL